MSQTSVYGETYLTSTTGSSNYAVLIQTPVAVGMRQKVLGPVGRATHVVCHYD